MIRLDGVSKRFGDLQALQATSLDFERGCTTALIGPSGCGKSTLVRLIAGLVASDTGQVQIDGELLTAANMRQLRHRMGYVIQQGGLFPHLSARDNATLLARHLRWKPAETERRLVELVELTHLPADVLDRYPNQLSGGQRQRVSLIRALFLDPDVLLLDEPMGALDPMIRRDLQDELRDIFRTLHKTVVLVTHDLSEAAYLADRIVLLRDGRVIQIGSLDDLLQRPTDSFVQRFVRAQRSPIAHDEEADA